MLIVLHLIGPLHLTLISDWYSSFNRCTHMSFSLGPALVCNNGMPLNVLRVLSSTIILLERIKFYGSMVNGNDADNRDY